jgi:hypothetical protein
MRTKILAAVGALAVAGAVLAGVATAGDAGSTPKQQRIAIVLHDQSSTFGLSPLTSGPIQRDSGTFSACCWTRHLLTRDGQSIEIDNPTLAFTSKRGTFTWHARITFVDLNNDYTVVTGVWRIAGGTGAYAGLAGHGRQAFVERTDGNLLADKAEGLMGLR